MLRMAKNGKKLHESPFSTLETTNWGKKSNYQNLPHSIFEESYEDAICQISGNFDGYCRHISSFVEIFKTLFCPNQSKNSKFCLSDFERKDNASSKTYWKSPKGVYILQNFRSL